MLECLILGDSIAHGIANIRKECNRLAEIGINSVEFNRKYGKSMLITEMDPKTVIISLGSNDSTTDRFEREIRQLRSTIKTKDVIWIIPSEKKQEQRHIVTLVAAIYNDRMVEIPAYSWDGIHPSVRGYDEIVKRTR
jgi:lysophospholipase L1-like esterase